jgi:hypothetical protein
MRKARSIRAFAQPLGAGFVVLCVALGLAAQSVPKYKVDASWPKPLPHKWKMGGVTGLAVDKDDNVWVLDRPDDLTDIELEADLKPPIADCCTRPPAMIHFDKDGNVIGYFDPPQGHGMAVDDKGFVYIGNYDHGLNTVRKYDPKTGKLVGEVPRAPEEPPGQGGGPPPTSKYIPGHGSRGPVYGFLPYAHTPLDAGQMERLAKERAAFYKKYPPTTPMIVGQIEEVQIDNKDHELYCTDSYLGGRLMVFDLDTLKFKRGWGAYGHKLSEITTNPADRDYKPGGPEPKEFRGHLTLGLSNDGLVYAADRMANRIQVFTKEGKYLKEFILAPYTGVGGSTDGIAFSLDPEQRILIVPDLTNNHIWFLNRQTGKVLGKMGSMGENAGQFFGLHMLATDSKGNIYTGEVFGGERVQKFVLVK